MGNLRALGPTPDTPAGKAFMAYVPGFVRIGVEVLPRMADQDRRRWYKMFVVVDRAIRWVYVALKPNRTARSARPFLTALAKACPVRHTRLLIDNATELTDRGPLGRRVLAPGGQYACDRLCHKLGIEHLLTPPSHPQTNARWNASRGVSPTCCARTTPSTFFPSSENQEQTLHRAVTLYNHHLAPAGTEH